MTARIISNPTDITPTFAVDSEADLQAIIQDKKYDDQGITAIVIPTAEVWMIDGNKKWVKL